MSAPPPGAPDRTRTDLSPAVRAAGPHGPGDPGLLWHLAAAELRAAGVERVFGLPGDDMQPVIALQDAGVRLVTTRSQRSAVLAAAAHAQLTGRPGVVVAGRGPGATALVPGLLEARSAGAPLVVLAGGVPLGAGHAGAFQEAPQLALIGPLADHAQRVESARQVPAATRRALTVAATLPARITYLELPDPPLGSTHVDWPGGHAATAEAGSPRRPEPRSAPCAPAALPELLLRARRPVILAGAGARTAGPRVLGRLADALGAPLLVTASGRGAVDETGDRFLGLAGLYLTPPAQDLVAECDLVVALGSRLEETAVEHLPDDVPTVQVNLDPAGFATDRPGLLVTAEVAATARAWADRLIADARPDPAWTARADEARAAAQRWAGSVATPGSLPAVLRELAGRLPSDAIVCHENGQADMWSYLAPVFPLPPGASAVVPSEQTTLGAGCAAALGAARVAGPDGRPRPVVVVTGDGAFATVADELGAPQVRELPVLYVVLSDGAFGWLETQLRAAGAPRGRFTEHAIAVPTRVPVTVVSDRSRAGALFDREIARMAQGMRVVVVPCEDDDRVPMAG